MGLRLDFAKASSASKSRMEVSAYNLMYQKLSLAVSTQPWALDGGSRAPLIWNLEGILDVICLLRHPVNETCANRLVDAETKEVDSPFRIFLKLPL
jgi:hypothetical protein